MLSASRADKPMWWHFPAKELHVFYSRCTRRN